MSPLAKRIDRLEGTLGADDTDRWLRTLTDEELEAEIERLGVKARQYLEAMGVPCADIEIKDVVARLEEIERAEPAQ